MSEQEKPFVFSPLQEKWLQALESGDWKQGTLLWSLDKGSVTYCCLGVACELMGLQKINSCEYRSRGNRAICGIMDCGAYEELGLLDAWGSILPTRQESLVGMNDSGKTFAEIAAYIRANPRNVFVEASECPSS